MVGGGGKAGRDRCGQLVPLYCACGMTVSDALASLSPDDRSVIVKAFYLAMPVTEIAQREHTSESAVKLRLHQAMHALRSATREHGTGY